MHELFTIGSGLVKKFCPAKSNTSGFTNDVKIQNWRHKMSDRNNSEMVRDSIIFRGFHPGVFIVPLINFYPPLTLKMGVRPNANNCTVNIALTVPDRRMGSIENQ